MELTPTGRRHEHDPPVINGIVCPTCGHDRTRVIYTRPFPERVRRRRECLACGQRVTTEERMVGRNVPVPDA